MVKKMNKQKFIKTIKENLNTSEAQANIINNIIESNNIFSKKNKDKIINDFIEQLNIDKEKAENIYETSLNIITNTIKNKIKHPFKKEQI